MIEKVDIAIVGATTIIGETLLEILEERKFPVGKLYLVDNDSSAGGRQSFKGQSVKIEDINSFNFALVQIAFFVSSENISADFVEKATGLGCIVIDRTSVFRNDEDVPLVIPEVNAEAIADYQNRNIIASPSCATIQMLVALKPIYDAVGINRINVSTYQSVSGSGKDASEELAAQTAALLNFREVKVKTYAKQIAFNLLPQIGEFQENGYTHEEMKLVWETKKVLNDDSIQINPTAVRVPVFIGHAATVHIETDNSISAELARDLFQQAEGVELLDGNQPGEWPTPVSEAAGSDLVYVGRVREDISIENGLDAWIVTDNIRKGGAVNIVQIAEVLVKLYI